MSHIADVLRRTLGDKPSPYALDDAPPADGGGERTAPHPWELTEASGAVGSRPATRAVIRAPGVLRTRPPQPAVAATGNNGGGRGGRRVGRAPAEASENQPL